MRRSALLIPVVVAILAATTGCTPGEDSTQIEPAPSETTRSIPGSETTSPSDLPDIPILEDSEGIVSSVTLDSCSTDVPMQAAGTVENTSDEAKDIVIVINWATERGDVLARAVEVLPGVPGGASEDWDVAVQEKPVEAVQCSLTAMAGTPG